MSMAQDSEGEKKAQHAAHVLRARVVRGQRRDELRRAAAAALDARLRALDEDAIERADRRAPHAQRRAVHAARDGGKGEQ